MEAPLSPSSVRKHIPDDYDYSNNKKSKVQIHSHYESKENDDDHPHGLISHIHHSSNEDDNVSEITPIKSVISVKGVSKYGILDNLFRRIFEGNGPSDTISQLNGKPPEREPIKSKAKPTEINRNASTLKVHPYEQKSVVGDNESDRRRQFFVHSMRQIFPELLNTRDLTGVEDNLKDVCTEDCIFKTPALKEPVVGVHHIIEMYKSILRTCADFQLEVISHEEDEIDGLIVLTTSHIITGNHVSTITISKKINNYIIV